MWSDQGAGVRIVIRHQDLVYADDPVGTMIAYWRINGEKGRYHRLEGPAIIRKGSINSHYVDGVYATPWDHPNRVREYLTTGDKP